MWEKQTEIIQSILQFRRTMVLGCVSSSKTMTTACAILWWLSAFYPSRAFSMAPTHRQVEINLWGEISRLHRNARVPIGGQLNQTELKLDRDWYALGFSTDRPDYLHGIHGPNDLIIVDEAQGIPQEIFDAIENTMAGGNTRFLGLCNPNVLSGEVYEAVHTKRSMYNVIQISAFDTPNVKAGHVIIPGMITKEQVEEWLHVYGEDSNFCRVKVFAKFPKQEADTLIPIDWIEMAFSRKVVVPGGTPTIVGVDVARYGDDRTSLTARTGLLVRNDPKRIYSGKSNVEVADLCEGYGVLLGTESFNVDVIGVGSGVVDILEDRKRDVVGVNVAEASEVLDDNENPKFANLRSQIWWEAREKLDPENSRAIAIEVRDNELMAELCSVKWGVKSGRIAIESKEEMKKRLGRSPDRADSFCLALYEPKQRSRKPVAYMGKPAHLPYYKEPLQKTADWM